MAIKVRTCKTLAEFQEAIGAISEYGGWEVDDDVAKNFLRCHPLDHMHAAFDGKRAVGGAGAARAEREEDIAMWCDRIRGP